MRRALGVAVLAAVATSTVAASVTDIKIQPGPSVMSTAERAVAADVSKGIQHGVVLVEETERNDNVGTITELAYRMRAKILSPEGRGLGDISIPVARAADLKKFWGRTILPDGQVQELLQTQLTAQSLAKTSVGEVQALKGALPGVVPGCVIEYGYVVQLENIQSITRVFLQKAWPVRSMRYRWVPSSYLPAAYLLSRSEGLPIDAKYDSHSVLVTAHDLNPVAEEPSMPPLDEVRASATFYYTTNEKTQEYWDLRAKRVERLLKSFLGGGGTIKEIVDGLPAQTGATVEDKLKAAYAWLDLNVKNTLTKSAEEEEAEDQDDDEANNAKAVLKAKEGSPRDLDFLFAGMARALGAEANVVYAVDRTDRFWNKSLKSMDQFGYTFVTVHLPNQPEGSVVFVDAGSGLPYGEVPWRATGSSALACSAKGSASVLIPPAPPVSNRADSHVTLKFSEENETMIANWNRTAAGATGFEYRRWLRDLDARERKDALDRLCGASGSVEVTAAELPGLGETAGAFRIACDFEDSNMSVGEEIARYSLPMTGPWWPEIPDFSATSRVNAVVFDYPRVEVSGMDVTAPHGFKSKASPAPIKLESPYGRYQLFVKQTPTGYHVDRLYALVALMVKPVDYDKLRQFLDDARKADRTLLAFERGADTE